MMLNQGAVRAVCALLRICPLSAMANYCIRDGTIALKGSHSMRDRRIFLKSLRDNPFDKDLSNEPNFGRIHLAGQYP
jgi:hypothetical protein